MKKNTGLQNFTVLYGGNASIFLNNPFSLLPDSCLKSTLISPAQSTSSFSRNVKLSFEITSISRQALSKVTEKYNST